MFGLFLVGRCCWCCKIRRTVLMPIIFLLCTVGAFASASRLFDIYAMLAIGIGAFFLRRRGYQMAPFVLGLVLGAAAGQEPAPRPRAVGRQPRAVLHPADQHRLRGRHHLRILLMYIPAFKSLVTSHHRDHQPADPAACVAAAPERAESST